MSFGRPVVPPEISSNAMSAGSGSGSGPDGSHADVGQRGELGRVAGHEHVRQRRDPGLHGAGQRAVVEAADDVGDDVADGAGQVGEVADLGLAVRGQAHHRDHPGAQQAEEDLRELGAVG